MDIKREFLKNLSCIKILYRLDIYKYHITGPIVDQLYLKTCDEIDNTSFLSLEIRIE